MIYLNIVDELGTTYLEYEDLLELTITKDLKTNRAKVSLIAKTGAKEFDAKTLVVKVKKFQ